jgi:ribbon-helix-helix CopG family protein
VTKLTISLPEELAEVVRRAAEREGTSVSALIAKELRRYDLLEQRRLGIAEYEAEHGEIPDDGGERVRAWLKRAGVEWPPSPSTPER